MSAWKKLARIIESIDEASPSPPKMQKPPPIPGSKERAASSPGPYLPGIHDPNSPMRPGKNLKKEEPDEAKVNWGKISQKRNMDRWGAISGREHDKQRSRLQSPDSVFADYDRQQALKRMAPPGEIPFGSDKPGQSNPLMAPSSAGTQTTRPRPGWQDLLDIEPGSGEEPSED